MPGRQLVAGIVCGLRGESLAGPRAQADLGDQLAGLRLRPGRQLPHDALAQGAEIPGAVKREGLPRVLPHRLDLEGAVAVRRAFLQQRLQLRLFRLGLCQSALHVAKVLHLRGQALVLSLQLGLGLQHLREPSLRLRHLLRQYFLLAGQGLRARLLLLERALCGIEFVPELLLVQSLRELQLDLTHAAPLLLHLLRSLPELEALALVDEVLDGLPEAVLLAIVHDLLRGAEQRVDVHLLEQF
mmetsp:Transcript_100723/g.307915  ORF Transcript_100723/g.307915 Transcript_100723/m.307915 type:complete len:242 (-) Transcript_100723:835-1560(-)